MEWLFLIIILIFSIVIHEVSHGTMANYLGDPTAREDGRLTLNPLKHLDPVGSILLPGFLILMREITGVGIIFGWAKPVPINPFNFRNRKYDSAKVALAGPAANLSLALFFGLSLRFLPVLQSFPNLYLMFSFIVYLNILLVIFNLLPIPPLDGSHILFAFLPRAAEGLQIFLSQFGLFILFFIIFFYFDKIIWIIRFVYVLIVGTAPF